MGWGNESRLPCNRCAAPMPPCIAPRATAGRWRFRATHGKNYAPGQPGMPIAALRRHEAPFSTPAAPSRPAPRPASGTAGTFGLRRNVPRFADRSRRLPARCGRRRWPRRPSAVGQPVRCRARCAERPPGLAGLRSTRGAAGRSAPPAALEAGKRFAAPEPPGGAVPVRPLAPRRQRPPPGSSARPPQALIARQSPPYPGGVLRDASSSPDFSGWRLMTLTVPSLSMHAMRTSATSTMPCSRNWA